MRPPFPLTFFTVIITYYKRCISKRQDMTPFFRMRLTHLRCGRIVTSILEWISRNLLQKDESRIQMKDSTFNNSFSFNNLAFLQVTRLTVMFKL